jgi:hypothetical protein
VFSRGSLGARARGQLKEHDDGFSAQAVTLLDQLYQRLGIAAQLENESKTLKQPFIL